MTATAGGRSDGRAAAVGPAARRAVATAVDVTAGAVAVEGRIAGGRRPTAAVLRLRDATDEMTLPLTVDGDGRHFSFALPPAGADGPELAEGVWDVYVEHAGDSGRGVARLADERGPYESTTYPLPAVAGPRSYLQPYTTVRGNVSLRVRHAHPHVEVAAVWVEDERVSLHGRLRDATGRESAELVLRAAGREVTVPASVAGDAVRADLDPSALVAALAEGDVGLVATAAFRLSGDPGELPVGAWLDDIRDKRAVIRYPAASAEDGRTVWAVRPEWSAENALTVRIEPSPGRAARALRKVGPA